MLVVWVLPSSAKASDTSSGQAPTLDQLQDKVMLLEEKLDTLEKAKPDAGVPGDAPAKASDAPVLGAGSEGFLLRSADSKFVLKLRGYIQADGRFWIDDEDPAMTNTFLLRRVRPIMEGVVWKYFGFKIMPDFAEGKTVLFDAYMDFTYLQPAKLRIGKFKVPVGLERLQSGTNLLFVERALPTNLVPNRDIGVQIYADLFDQALSYAAGIFNGVPDLGNADLDIDDDKEFAGRVFAHPFKPTSIKPLQGLGLGVAGTVGSRAGKATATGLPSYKTPAQQTFFTYLIDTKVPENTVVSTGMQYRVSPQAYWYWGPLGILGEYVLSSQQAKKKAQIERFQNTAWQVAASVVLTGDAASYKGVNPTHPFDPADGGWGAVELAGRYAELKVDPDIFPKFSDPKKSARQAREWAVGVNWYLNRNFKIMLDYEQTSFQGGGTRSDGLLADREDEHAILSEFQIAF